MKQRRKTSVLSGPTEKQFQAQVIRLARLYGWLCFHTYDSRRSQPGFPDLVLLHAERRRLILAELKTERGRLTAYQEVWIESLRAAGAPVFVWRPSMLDEIVVVLTGGTVDG